MQCLGLRCCPVLQVEQREGAELADFLRSLEPEGWDRAKAVADRPPKRSANAVSSRLSALHSCACTLFHSQCNVTRCYGKPDGCCHMPRDWNIISLQLLVSGTCPSAPNEKY